MSVSAIESREIAAVDARAAILAWLVAVLSVSACPDLSGVAMVATLSLGAVACRGREWWPRISGVLLFAGLIVVLLPWTVPGERIIVWQVSLSRRGLELAGLIVAKMLALFNLTWLLLAWYSPATLIRALAALGLPRSLVTLLWLTQRYLLVFDDELRRLRLALRVRGFRNRVSRHAWQTAGYAVGSLLVHGLDRADRVAQAWRLRGDGSLWLPSPRKGWGKGEVGVLAAGLGVATVPWLAKAFLTPMP